MQLPSVYNAPPSLTPIQKAGAALMAEGRSIREIAPLIGVTERTLVNWRAQPGYMCEVYEIQTQRLEASTGTDAAMLPEIIKILQGMVRGYEINEEGDKRNLIIEHTDRIRAAKVLMQAASEFRHRQLLERKISDLETRISILLAQGSPKHNAEGEFVDIDGTPLAEEDEELLFGIDPAEQQSDKSVVLTAPPSVKSKEIPKIIEPPELPPSAPLHAEGSFLDHL